MLEDGKTIEEKSVFLDSSIATFHLVAHYSIFDL